MQCQLLASSNCGTVLLFCLWLSRKCRILSWLRRSLSSLPPLAMLTIYVVDELLVRSVTAYRKLSQSDMRYHWGYLSTNGPTKCDRCQTSHFSRNSNSRPPVACISRTPSAEYVFKQSKLLGSGFDAFKAFNWPLSIHRLVVDTSALACVRVKIEIHRECVCVRVSEKVTNYFSSNGK